MVIPVPSQGYLDSLITSIREQGLVPARLCELLFAIVDRFCAQPPHACGPGHPKTYTDNLILKLDMLMHLTGKRGETEILREAERHYRHYFPSLPKQPRLWHRLRQALPLIERFRRSLRKGLGVDFENLRILDSVPIPVAIPTSAPGRGNGFEWAEGGYCASKKLKYLGFKMGLLITPQGIPEAYDLFSARPQDVRLLDDLLGECQDVFALGDKGFISQVKQAQLAREQNVILITYRRRHQKEKNTPLETWLLHTYRQLIETVFSQLNGHMHIEPTGAKTDVGLVKRVVGIVTAFTLGIHLNALLGRELLAIKELFA